MQYGNATHSSDEYGLYSSGTGTGAFTGPYDPPSNGDQHYGLPGGMLHHSTGNQHYGLPGGTFHHSTGDQHYALPGGTLHHSTGSSSSSEDGLGGKRRKKKKFKNKVKESASHSGDRSHFTAATGIIPPAVGLKHQGEHYHQKKGIIDKIKEKLRGSHQHH